MKPSSIESVPRDTLEQWKQKRSVIGRLSNVALQAWPTVDSEMETAPLGSHYDKYELLGLNMWDAFVAAVRSESEQQKHDSAVVISGKGVRHGFLILARIIGHSVDAYKKLCKDQGRTGQAEELVEILRYPKSCESTALFLAGLPSKVNDVWELTLGLVGVGYEYREANDIPLFRINNDTSTNEKYLEISPHAINWVDSELINQGLHIYRQKPSETCRARAYLPAMWDSYVTACAEMPSLFATDIEQFQPPETN